MQESWYYTELTSTARVVISHDVTSHMSNIVHTTELTGWVREMKKTDYKEGKHEHTIDMKKIVYILDCAVYQVHVVLRACGRLYPLPLICGMVLCGMPAAYALLV